ncbi:unnamed protein product [Echinostoma caproni]|uniref:Uncharacterized protein n=1 Tax=Echinostoma caproni TaxID=27848 RepID=A0A183A0C1_9TREM|nr:unnamed protein product [Echinostoma caproni]
MRPARAVSPPQSACRHESAGPPEYSNSFSSCTQLRQAQSLASLPTSTALGDVADTGPPVAPTEDQSVITLSDIGTTGTQSNCR